MRRIGVILGICAFLLLATGGATSTTWLTYRDTVSVTGGTADINVVYWHNGTTTSTSRNITLPCQINNLSNSLTMFAIKANGGNIAYNLNVNGITVRSSTPVTDGNWSNTTLADISGLDATKTYLNFTFSVSANTNIIKIAVYGNDAALTNSWLSNHIVIKEKDVSTIYVGKSSTSAFWTVNDSIAVTNTGLGYTLSDINLTLGYPSHKISPSSSYVKIDSLANSGTATKYVQYQKYAPYIYKVEDKSQGTNHEVVIYIKTPEILTKCVNWIIDPSDDVYKKAFDTLNTNTLSIEYAGTDIDYDISDGNIVIKDFTTKTTFTENKFVFTWTESEQITPPAEVPWYEQTIYGVPIWILIAVVIILFVAVLFYKR